MGTSLVTGGAGFIGSHLVEYLLERGDAVIVLDDLSTGSLDNLAAVCEHERVTIAVGSVLDEGLVGRLVKDSGRVFHLAAAVGVDLIVKQPARVIEINIHGTESVLRACKRDRIPVFIASTSEIYGKSESIPFREDADLVLGPTFRSRWSYACSKAIDEFMAFAYASEHALPVVIGRFFNTAGPRQTGQYGMVVPRFVRQALTGTPITVYGSGQQTRCFTHVLDIVPAIVALLETPQALGEVVNLGTTQPVTIRELADLVKQIVGSASEIVHVPFDDAYAAGFEDIEARVPDVSKARRLIGFSPKYDLPDILRSVLASAQTSVCEGS